MQLIVEGLVDEQALNLSLGRLNDPSLKERVVIGQTIETYGLTASDAFTLAGAIASLIQVILMVYDLRTRVPPTSPQPVSYPLSEGVRNAMQSTPQSGVEISYVDPASCPPSGTESFIIGLRIDAASQDYRVTVEIINDQGRMVIE
jgi:hypothetical protein